MYMYMYKDFLEIGYTNSSGAFLWDRELFVWLSKLTSFWNWCILYSSICGALSYTMCRDSRCLFDVINNITDKVNVFDIQEGKIAGRAVLIAGQPGTGKTAIAMGKIIYYLYICVATVYLVLKKYLLKLNLQCTRSSKQLQQCTFLCCLFYHCIF